MQTSESNEVTRVVSRLTFLSGPSDLARALQVPIPLLLELIRISDLSGHYERFSFRKRSGGTRLIEAPNDQLQLVQRRLATILLEEYRPSVCAMAYIPDRGIVANAQEHARKRWVLNVDLADFFHSITTARITAVLQGRPFYCNRQVATAIGHIATVHGRLPMGSPSSPTISNIAAWNLDVDLVKLAKRHKCYVTRYSDDITFSTNQEAFPEPLGRLRDDGQSDVGDELLLAINENGFEHNPRKTWLMGRGGRQTVTGLVVNDRVNVPRRYIRNTKAVLHDWRTHGYREAEARLQTTFSNPHRHPDTRSLDRVVAGKIAFIEHVRGSSDHIVLSLWRAFDELRSSQGETGQAREEWPGTEDIGVASPLRILHLSDFHFRDSMHWDSEPMLRRMTAKLEPETYDLCIITGDVAFSGKREEYELAREFIDSRLLPSIGLNPDDLFIVPGNHDVDRSMMPFPVKYLRQNLNSNSVTGFVMDILQDNTHAASMLSPLSSYLSFASNYGDARARDTDHPWFMSGREIRGNSVYVAGLCSVLLSMDDYDHGRLAIGLPILNSVIAKDNGDIHISAMHHPESWLHESESDVQSELERWSDVILHGHLHRRRTESVLSSSRDSFHRIAAGACYQGSTWRGSFNSILIHPETKAVQIRECRWDEEIRDWEWR